MGFRCRCCSSTCCCWRPASHPPDDGQAGRRAFVLALLHDAGKLALGEPLPRGVPAHRLLQVVLEGLPLTLWRAWSSGRRTRRLVPTAGNHRWWSRRWPSTQRPPWCGRGRNKFVDATARCTSRGAGHEITHASQRGHRQVGGLFEAPGHGGLVSTALALRRCWLSVGAGDHAGGVGRSNSLRAGGGATGRLGGGAGLIPGGVVGAARDRWRTLVLGRRSRRWVLEEAIEMHRRAVQLGGDLTALSNLALAYREVRAPRRGDCHLAGGGGAGARGCLHPRETFRLSLAADSNSVEVEVVRAALVLAPDEASFSKATFMAGGDMLRLVIAR